MHNRAEYKDTHTRMRLNMVIMRFIVHNPTVDINMGDRKKIKTQKGIGKREIKDGLRKIK